MVTKRKQSTETKSKYDLILWWKTLEIGHKITIWGLIVTFAFSSYSVYQSYQSQKETDKLNYLLNSLNFEPKIKIIGNPVFLNILCDTTSSTFSEEKSTLMLYIRSKLKLTNIGNARGTILYHSTLNSKGHINSLQNCKSRTSSVQVITKLL